MLLDNRISSTYITVFLEVKLTPEVTAAYGTLKNAIAEVLENSEFFIIKLSKLFEKLQPEPVVEDSGAAAIEE